MSFIIRKSITYLLGISLETPFPLGFGTLDRLPRVLFRILAEDGDARIEGIGEASIDFPFTNYDAWDVYDALSKVNLAGEQVSDRDQILTEYSLQQDLLAKYPAALAALNMAIDDIYGKASHISVGDIYGRQREGGKALASISFKENADDLIAEVKSRLRAGFIPKIKAGDSIEKDFTVFSRLNGLTRDGHIPSYVVDFNARYSVDEFEGLVDKLRETGFRFENALFLEQPTSKDAGIAGLQGVKGYLEIHGVTASVLADESFVSEEDAIGCAERGILLNFKIQKIGGAHQARRIEKRLKGVLPVGGYYPTTVGGTFPTAIGRAYDQHCASILEYARLPSDAWEPSTDWFTDEKHLIKEDFRFNPGEGVYLPMDGFGLGVTVDWTKVDPFVIENPQEEYRNIRQGIPGEKIRIRLRQGHNYKEIYESMTAKPWNWNLK